MAVDRDCEEWATGSGSHVSPLDSSPPKNGVRNSKSSRISRFARGRKSALGRALVLSFAIGLMAAIAAGGQSAAVSSQNFGLGSSGMGANPSTPEAPPTSAVAPLQVAGSFTVVTASGSVAAGAFLQLLRYPEGGAIPSVVGNATTGSDGRAQLVDATLGTFEHKSDFVNYAVRAMTSDGLAVYHWSDQIDGGTLVSPSNVLLGGSLQQPASLTLHLQTGTQASPAVGPTVGKDIEFCHYKYDGVVWGPSTLLTIMGEAHSTADETTTFIYGENAGSSLEVQIQYSGQGWQLDGSNTVSNSLGYSVTWPGLSGGSAYQTESDFSYQENYYEGLYCPFSGYYEALATSFQGGTAWGAAAGGDNACRTGSAWASWLPGSSGSKQQSSGITYSAAVTLPIGITLTDTTSYSSNEQVNFQFGSGPARFYTYNPSGWLNVQFSSTQYCPLEWTVNGSSTSVTTCSTCSVTVAASGGSPNDPDYLLFSLTTTPPSNPTGTGCTPASDCPPADFENNGDLSGQITLHSPPSVFYAWLYDPETQLYSNMITFNT